MMAESTVRALRVPQEETSREADIEAVPHRARSQPVPRWAAIFGVFLYCLVIWAAVIAGAFAGIKWVQVALAGVS